jgi:mycothiol synthase
MVDVRRVTPEQYAAGAAELIATVTAAALQGDGVDPLDEATRLRLRYHRLTDSALWLSDDGFALVRRGHTHADGSYEPARLDVVVAPAARRTGQGRTLASAAAATLDEDLLAWSHGDHPGAAALAHELDFRRVRELLMLERDLTGDEPLDGPDQGSRRATGTAAIRAFRPGDETELLRVNQAAFANHPEQGSMGPENLAERMAEPWFDPAGLLIADAGDHLIGFHWTKVHPDGEGEIYVLGIDPAAQGTGLGTQLARAGLAHLATRGCTIVHLYVEATNMSAVALYRRLGFSDRRAHAEYRRSRAARAPHERTS